MKKISMLCMAICLMLSFKTMAQMPQMPEPKEATDNEMKRLTKDLKLSDELVAKITPIVLKYAEMRKETFETGRQSRNFQEIRTKMEALSLAKAGEIKPLLSAEQQKKYDKTQRKMQNEMRNRMAPPMMGGQ